MTEENKNEEQKQQLEDRFQITNNTNLTPLSNRTSGFRSINDTVNDTGGFKNYITNDDERGYRTLTQSRRGDLSIQNDYLFGGTTGFDNQFSIVKEFPNKVNFGNNVGGPKLITQKEPPKINIEKKQVSAPKWIGPMNQFTTFKSSFDAQTLGNQTEKILKMMVTDKKVDYSRNNAFSFIGRMYSRNDLSEFQIQLYQNGQQNDKLGKTIFELRRTSGDSFVHEDFFISITKQLSESKFLNFSDQQNSFGGLEPLTLKDFAFSDNDEDDNDENFDFDMDENTDVDMTDDNNSLTLDTNNTEEWAQDLVDVLKDRDSYRDTWRHSATQLCFELQNQNKEMLEYVVKQDNIIDNIFKPLTQQLYDCLIIKTVLEIVSILLDNNVEPNNAQEMIYQIGTLSSDWTNGPKRNMGPLTMSFTKSQQICAQCESCSQKLHKLMKRN